MLPDVLTQALPSNFEELPIYVLSTCGKPCSTLLSKIFVRFGKQEHRFSQVTLEEKVTLNLMRGLNNILY